IILVIPTQTQLRSHVSWRLLHARARELGRDVLIVSSDRQIRSVVKAAGFRVADSLESPPSSKPHRGSRPGRIGLGGKTSPRLRTPSGKVAADQQASATVSTDSGVRGGGARVAKEGRRFDQQYADRPAAQQDVEERQRSRTQ